MPKLNAENERIKHEYLGYAKDAMQKSEETIDAIAAALHRFDVFTNNRNYKKFRAHVARDYKAFLAKQKNRRTGKRLCKATQRGELQILKVFFQWLHGRPGYRSCFALTDANYFNMTRNDVRESLTSRPRPYPTLEMVNQVLEAMPFGTDIEKRDRAIIAFAIITAARIDAIRTFKLRDVELAAGRVYHDARHVASKRRKSFSTDFAPIPGNAEAIVREWVEFLTQEKECDRDDPLFPKTLLGQDSERKFQAVGISRAHWETTQPIRKIYRRAFNLVGLPYYHPHSFRHTLVAWVKNHRLSQAEWEAFSQNIGHSDTRITSQSYGKLSEADKTSLIRGIADNADDTGLAEEILAVAKKYRIA